MSKRRNPDEKVVVERLADATGFETYRFVTESDDKLIATIALRCDVATWEIEYGVWIDGRDASNPTMTGGVECSEEVWNDEAREHGIRRIVCRHEDELRFDADNLEIFFGEMPLDEDDDDEEGDDDEDED